LTDGFKPIENSDDTPKIHRIFTKVEACNGKFMKKLGAIQRRSHGFHVSIILRHQICNR